jgi:hypothetical protein
MISSFMGRRMSEEQYINLPVNLKRIQRFAMVTKLYHPELELSDLSTDAKECRAQIDAEAERIRAVMQDLFDDLAASQARRV